MSDWALVVTSPNAERRVAGELCRKKYPFHFFRRRVLTVYRGQLTHKEIPAFPRYFFVPLAACWEIVRDVVDVISVVAFEPGKPAKVRESAVQRLISVCTGDGILIEPKRQARFKPGDEIFVETMDSLIYHRGRFHHACEDGSGRAIILMDWLGRQCFVSVRECDLREVRRPQIERRRKRRRNGRHRRLQPATDLCSAAA